MKWQSLILSVFISSSAFGSVKSYFNHTKSARYIDPYRNISRNGDNLEQVILDQIALAKKTIFIAVQELRLPKIAEALIQKKNKGVDVRIVMEHDYNFNVLAQRDSNDSNEYEASKLSELKA